MKKNPCETIGEVVKGQIYRSDEFNEWIVLMEGECKKEEESVTIREGKELKIKGDGEVVKYLGRVVGNGVLCGDESILCIEGITMKEQEEDILTVPLIVWKGGYVNMSGVHIVRVGGGGGTSVLINTSDTNQSVMSHCAIKYEWMNALSLLDRRRRNDDTDMCSWNSGVIVLTNNSGFKMNAMSLNGSRSGGIVMSGGEINLSECFMVGTADVSENYSSVKHNIICSSKGEVSIDTYNGEQITTNTSLWVLSGDCTLSIVEGEGEVPKSLLFVPRLDAVMYNNDNGNGEITFCGAVLIACGLWYEILYPNGNPQMADPVSLAGSDVVSENDSILSFPMVLPEEMNYSARLRFGTADKLCMTDAVSISWKGEESHEDSKMGSTVGMNITIVIVIVVTVVVIALIISGVYTILCQVMKRRKKNKRDDMNMVLLESDTQQIRSE